MLIELLSLGTAEALRAIIGSKSAIVDPKFQVEGVAPSPILPSSQKTRLNVLSYSIKIWTDFSSVLSQFTRLMDRQTDRILITRPRLHGIKTCSRSGGGLSLWRRGPPPMVRVFFRISNMGGVNQTLGAVSYTHLTLPTNREV